MIDESLSVRFPAIVSLKQEDTQAYFIQNAQASSMLDAQIGLLDDKLITHWNDINAVYDELQNKATLCLI